MTVSKMYSAFFHDSHYGLQPFALELFQGVSQIKLAHRILRALSGDQIFWVEVSKGSPMAQNGLYWPKQSNITLKTQNGPKFLISKQ